MFDSGQGHSETLQQIRRYRNIIKPTKYCERATTSASAAIHGGLSALSSYHLRGSYAATASAPLPADTDLWAKYVLVLTLIFSSRLPNHSVALSAQRIHFGLHPGQQLFRRSGRYAGPLKRLNVLPLAVDLPAHMFDFCSYGGKLHGPDPRWSDKNKKRINWQATKVSVRPAEHPKKRLRSG